MALKYYLPEKKESNLIQLFKKYVFRVEPVPEVPYHIQIQTTTYCNGRCVFCPYMDTSKKLPHGNMDMDLFKKIVDECLEFGIKHIRPYLMNEPLCDKTLPEKIKYLSLKKTDDFVVKINTNASLLDEEMGRRLIEAQLDRINVSFHGSTKEIYEKCMNGLVYEKVLSNIENFLKLKEKMGSSKPHVKITMVKTKNIADKIPEIKQFWVERGLKVNIRPMTNRLNKRIESLDLNVNDWDTFTWCKRLNEQAYVLYNGDMILCCNDWLRTTIMGNLREHTIKEIWNNEKYYKIRKQFLSGNVDGLICKACLMT